MPNSTDYWLQGMQVANQDRQTRNAELKDKRDYLTRNKLYYGEDWRGNDKGETDFKASEEARKARIAEDAAAALEPYLGGSRTPAVIDPRAVPGMSEADADFGAPQAVVESLPNTRQTTPAVGDFGAPIGTDVPVVRVVTPPKLTNTDSAGEDLGNWDEVLASLPKQTVPEVQPDAPRYIPVENTLGSPPVSPAAAVPVVAPPVGNDFGASTIPTTPVRPASPVPNTSTFGAPLANIMPSAREIFDNTDPNIRSKPAFLNELKAYEKNRLNQVARLAQAEELGNIRAASAYNLLHERTKSAAELAAEKDKRAMERQDDKQEFEREKYAVLERGRNERYNTGIQTRKDLAELKVKAQAVGAPKIAGADDTIVKESGRQLATKTMAADVMENALGIIEDPNTDPAVAYSEAQSLYKAINSADFRSDAVNGEEAKRIGQLLDINLNPVKIIQTGRVLPSLELYKKQVRDNVNRIRKESDALNNRISSVYAKYGWDYQNAKPLGSAPAQPASTNAPSGPKVMTINGKKVTFTP